jgi:hypothetical protein
MLQESAVRMSVSKDFAYKAVSNFTATLLPTPSGELP